MYQLDSIYYKFEHSSSKCKGIFSYESEKDLLKAEVDSFCKRHFITSIKNLKLILYDKIPEHATLQEIKEEFKKKENMIKTWKELNI